MHMCKKRIQRKNKKAKAYELSQTEKRLLAIRPWLYIFCGGVGVLIFDIDWNARPITP